jgi:hypothetical protein
MYTVPFQINSREYSIFIVLEDENIERMKAYDPAQLNLITMGPHWKHLRIRDIHVGYAAAADIKLVTDLIQDNKAAEALAFLSRGFRRELGDNEPPYLVAEAKGETAQ